MFELDLEKAEELETKLPTSVGSSKSPQIINAREGMEKKQPSYAAGGNVKHYSHYGEQLKKTKNRNNMFQQSHS